MTILAFLNDLTKVNGASYDRYFGGGMMENHVEIKSSKYQQVAVAVAKRIINGDYEIGEKLKSRSTLASMFNVSPETARKGLNILADMKIVSLKHGSGAVVLSKEKASDFLQNYEATHSITLVKEHITKNIKQQQEDLADLAHLVNEFVIQSRTVNHKYPFSPYEIIVKNDSEHLGKSIRELNIWHQTGATIVGIKHNDSLLISPSPYVVIEKNDHLFFVGDESVHSRMIHFFNLGPDL